MKVRDLIHKLTAEGIDMDYDVVFIDYIPSSSTKFEISSVGVNKENKEVRLNNLYR